MDQTRAGITHRLLGAKLGLLSFLKNNKDIKHIRVMMDNNTAVAYINNMAGIRSNLCDAITFDICNGLQNNNYGFQQPTYQDLKMS